MRSENAKLVLSSQLKTWEYLEPRRLWKKGHALILGVALGGK